MVRQFVCGVVMASAGAAVLTAQEPRSNCSTLASLRLPDIKITDAVAVPPATTGGIRAAHCRVNGVVGTEIRFTLLLPDTWNTKFFMGGGGGFVGSVQNAAAATVNSGYATVGTDTGHQGAVTDASWAHNNLERQLNFGYLAVHRTAQAAEGDPRDLLRDGGDAQLLHRMLAGRRPGVHGSAALSRRLRRHRRRRAGVRLERDGRADDSQRPGGVSCSGDQRVHVHARRPEHRRVARVGRCDARDGLEDGVLDDPRQCAFDVNTLPLSDAKKAALKVHLRGHDESRRRNLSGAAVRRRRTDGGMAAWITGGCAAAARAEEPSLRFAFGNGIIKYLVFNDPTWDYSKYDLSNWKKDTALAATFLNATNPLTRSRPAAAN